MATSYIDYVLRFRDKVTAGLRGVRTEAKKTDKTVTSIQSSLTGLFAMAGAGYGISQLMKYGAELQKVEKSFEVLVGNKSGAEALLANVSEYAKNTNFGKMGLAKSAQDLLTYGVAAEKVMPTMKMLGDISLGNQERLKLLSFAYAQVQGAGKLMGQDLLQLINSGFNPLQIISQQTGKTMGELREMMQKGAISAEMVTQAMKIATSEGGRFFNGANALAETGAGRFDRMTETMMETAQVIGSDLLNALIPVFNVMTSLFEFLVKHKDTVMVIGAGVASLTAVLLGWWGAVKLVTVAQNALNIVMTANPIGLVIVAVAALSAGLYAAYKRFDGFREIVDTTWSILKKFGSNLKTIVTNPIESLAKMMNGVLAPFLEALALLRSGDYVGAAKALGKAVLLAPTNTLGGLGLANGIGSFDQEKNKLRVAAGRKGMLDYAAGMGQGAGGEGSAGGVGMAGVLGLGANSSGGLKSGLNSITGSAPKTFNINIERLTGIETLSTTNIQEGADELEQRLKRLLLNVLNDSQNLALS